MTADPLAVPQPVGSVPVTRTPFGYLSNLSACDIQLRLEEIGRQAGNLNGYLHVTSTMDGETGHLHGGRINIDSSETRKRLATHLREICSDSGWKDDWHAILESFCVRVHQLENEPPAVQYGGRLARSTQPRHLVQQLVELNQPNMFFGPGASGKGFLMIGLCVALKLGVPFCGFEVGKAEPLYLDYEDTLEAFNERVQFVAAGMRVEPPEIMYMAADAPFHRMGRGLQRLKERMAFNFLVVDSMQMALDTTERGAEETALAFYRSLRGLQPMTTCVIDHVAAAALNQKPGSNHSYGSIFKYNLTRTQWEIRADQEHDASTLHMGLYDTKTNHGAKKRPVGIEIEFGEDCVRFRREDIRESEKLAEGMSNVDRIAWVLRTGALSAEDIADQTGLAVKLVRVALSRFKDHFVNTSRGKWGNLEVSEKTPPAPVTHLRLLPDAPNDTDIEPF